MAEQFQLILLGMFIGSAVVWILTRRKVKWLEKKLQEAAENKKSENQLASGGAVSAYQKLSTRFRAFELCHREPACAGQPNGLHQRPCRG